MAAWPKPGDAIGPYLVRGHLGTSGLGQGQIFLAEHQGQKRKVTLAVLRPEDVDNPAARTRFFAEASALARVRHANLVEVVDVIDERPWPCFAVELLRGHSLEEVLRREGRVALPRAMHIAWQIASAMAAAHAGALVHNALQPRSIFLVDRYGLKGQVKIVDFTPFAEARGPNSNPAYMAPELHSGLPGDHRVDIYSFGTILYELAAGRRPFLALSPVEQKRAHLLDAPPAPGQFAQIPATLDALVLNCLKKEPDQRPESFEEVLESLKEIALLVDSFQPPEALTDPTGDFAVPGVAGWLVVPGQQTRPAPIAGFQEPGAADPAEVAAAEEELPFADDDVADLVDEDAVVALSPPWPGEKAKHGAYPWRGPCGRG